MECVGCHRDPSELYARHASGKKRCTVCHRDFPIDHVRMFGKWKQHAIKRWARDVRRKGGRVFAAPETEPRAIT